MKRIIIFISLIFFTSLAVSAQKNRKSVAGEDSLVYVSKLIASAPGDSVRNLHNMRFREILIKVISDPASFNAPFDSVKILGKITSPDEKFRIYNWNMPMSDGSNKYFAFLQIRDGKKIRVVELTDRSDSLTEPENKVLAPDSWYGALYYKVIHMKSGPKDIYTLLGWDGLNSYTSRKLIEILTFTQSGEPVFGARIFRGLKTGKSVRLFYDYPAGSSMILKFDEQTYTKGKKWNNSKRRFEEDSRTSPMIILDHLEPADPKSSVPAMTPSDMYDGFIFENGTWNFVTNIDARNPR